MRERSGGYLGLAGSQAEGAEMRILSNVGWVWQAFLLNPLFEPV